MFRYVDNLFQYINCKKSSGFVCCFEQLCVMNVLQHVLHVLSNEPLIYHCRTILVVKLPKCICGPRKWIFLLMMIPGTIPDGVLFLFSVLLVSSFLHLSSCVEYEDLGIFNICCE